MRLDVFLWHVRLTRTRRAAQALIEQGTTRLDGRRVEKAASAVPIGGVLTYVTPNGNIRAIRVEAFPSRRGPVPEARACYTVLLPENT